MMRKFRVFLSLVFVLSLFTMSFPILANNGIFVSGQTYGQSWSVPSNVTSLAGENFLGQADRAMAVDSSGNIHIVYFAESDNGAGTGEIYYATNIGGSWSMTNISKFNDTNNQCSSPVIAIAPNGVVHVVWVVGFFEDNIDIFYSNNSLGNWTTPINVTNTGSLFETSPTLTVGADNTVHLVFAQFNAWMGGNHTLIYTNFTINDGWSTPENLISSLPTAKYISNKKSIDVDPSGDLYVVFATSFSEFDSVDYIFMVNNSAGSWGNPVNISQIIQTGYLTENSPTMDIDGVGNIHLLWAAYNATDQRNFFYTYYNQDGWASPSFINASVYYLGEASLITDINNKVHIAFAQANSTGGGDYDVYYTCNVEGDFMDPVNITSNEGMDEWYPQIILDGQGYANIIFMNTTADTYVQYVRSLQPVIPGDWTPVIIVGAVLAVIVVAGAAFYFLRIRKPK